MVKEIFLPNPPPRVGKRHPPSRRITPPSTHTLGFRKSLTFSTVCDTIHIMKRPTKPDSLALYREHSLLTPQTPELMDFYINLISTHHLPLHTMFDEDARRCQQHLPLLYFPSTYASSIPPWGVVYYFWRRDGDSSFLDTLSEVEEEVLSTTHLDESLSTDDLSTHKLATSKYSLIKSHYSNPSKSTSLRNRQTQATLSHLSNESIRELIEALTTQSTQAPQSIPAPKPITIHEDDL